MTLRPSPTGALVLAAGLGIRLRPLTSARAKPALPVAGLTLVERILIGLRNHGVLRAIVNLHYRAETITAVVGDGTGLGLDVRYSWEVPLLGSGGGPRRAFSLVPDDRLWIVNGDTLTDLDFAAMAAEHERSSALVTMALIPNPSPDRYGGVLVDALGSVTGFVPRGSAAPSWHFVGVQIAERETFATLDDGVPADSVGPLYRSLIESRPGAIRAFCSQARFLDIGTPRDYLEACLAFGDGQTVIDATARVDPTAELASCVVWERARIGRRVRLTRAIVGEDVDVPDDYRASDVVLMRGEGEGTIAGTCALRPFPIG